MFTANPQARSYVLDDQAALRRQDLLRGFYRVGGVPTIEVLSPSEDGSADDFARVLDESVIEHQGRLYAWTIPLALPAGLLPGSATLDVSVDPEGHAVEKEEDGEDEGENEEETAA